MRGTAICDCFIEQQSLIVAYFSSVDLLGTFYSYYIIVHVLVLLVTVFRWESRYEMFLYCSLSCVTYKLIHLVSQREEIYKFFHPNHCSSWSILPSTLTHYIATATKAFLYLLTYFISFLVFVKSEGKQNHYIFLLLSLPPILILNI